MSFGLDFERLPIARPLAIFDMAPTAGNETFRSSCAPNHRASQREPDRDAPPMTRVAAVRVDDDNDDRQTLEGMLKTVKRRRRVDKAKVHRALALLARDLDLFVSSFNTRLKTIGQLTFHEAPDDLRVASIARGRGEKKRSRRAGARVQRGRRNEAKREGGVEASPKPLSTTTKNEKNKKTKEEEEDKQGQPSLKKQAQVAEARARRAEKEANELKTKLDAAMKAAADGPQEREDPTLRDVSSEVALFALESDVRIKTQGLREAEAKNKAQEAKTASYAARVRQLEGELEAEQRRRRRREEADEQAHVKAQLQQAQEARGDQARVSAVSAPPPPSPPPVQRRPTARLTPMAAASAASRAARRKEAAAQEAARAARPKKRAVAAVQRKG